MKHVADLAVWIEGLPPISMGHIADTNTTDSGGGLEWNVNGHAFACMQKTVPKELNVIGTLAWI